jgi:hypothetical protein
VDLDWFWSTWYYETWALDHAVESVEVEGPETVITIRDFGLAFMPFNVQVETSNGRSMEQTIPVSHWLTGASEAEIRVPLSEGQVTSVIIDASHGYPDMNRDNNRWVRR